MRDHDLKSADEVTGSDVLAGGVSKRRDNRKGRKSPSGTDGIAGAESCSRDEEGHKRHQ